MNNITELDTKYVVVLTGTGGGLPVVYGPFDTLPEAEEWQLPPGVDHCEPAVTTMHEPVTWS